MKRSIPFAVLTIILLLALSACSGLAPATSPDMQGPNPGDLTGQAGASRSLIGIWDVVMDYNGISVSDASDRVLAKHFDVKKFLKPPFCSDCIAFSNVTNDTTAKILAADVTITNPTEASGADIRGIVLSNDPLIYLANPDDYTTLYDKDIPANKNPFRRFGKDLTNGIVGPLMSVTEHFELHYNQIPFMFQTAVDANVPIQDKREPYEIKNQKIAGDLDTNGAVSRLFECDIYDRHNDTGVVSISSTELGIDIALKPDPDKANHYFEWLTNTGKKPAGEYKLLISATDSVVPEVLYDYLTVNVSVALGHWDIQPHPFTTGCPRDVAAGVNVVTGETVVFVPGGGSCQMISKTNIAFAAPTNYFNLNDIDSLNPGFSPFPVKRLDSSFTGGMAFCSSSDDTYSDGFYTGPISSLLITVFPNASGNPNYLNPGDGDAGRMYPSNSALRVVDVTDDLASGLYGLWADPDGVVPPEFYGLSPDYTRHDVFMGGMFPSNMVGSGAGKISPIASRIRALDVSSMGIGTGSIYILESNGTDSELEIFQFTVDYQTKATFYQPLNTILMPGVEAIDADIAMFNPTYVPNPDSDTIAVLVKGPSGGYIRMYSCSKFTKLEEIGSASSPCITGTPASLDMESSQWHMLVLNQENQAFVLSWVL